MSLQPYESVILSGTYLYAGTVECNVRIVKSPVRYGSGDYEDPPEIADDTNVETFYVQFSSSDDPNHFNCGIGGYSSLAEARAGAASATGIGHTVRWHSDAT